MARIQVLGAGIVLAWALGSPGPAIAFEYPLQFTPNPGAEHLAVAGYQIVGSTVIGNCSYVTVHSGSGRDPRSFTTHYDQTCTWDLRGNLLSMAQGAPPPQSPIGTSGTETIYARKSANVFTGSDPRTPSGGFVFLASAHYDWAPYAPFLVLPGTPTTFTATIVSDGEHPLYVASAHANVGVAKVKIVSPSCRGTIAPGATCAITVTYDPSGLTSPTGLAYDTLSIRVVADSQTVEFVQHYTVTVPIPPDDGGG